MSTVVPIGGNVTPALLLGWASAVCLGDELEDVALAFADDLGDDAGDVAGPEMGDEAVLWVAVPEAAPVLEDSSLTIPRTRSAAVPASLAR